MCEGLGGGRAEPHRVVGPDEGHVEPEGDPVNCPRLRNFWEFVNNNFNCRRSTADYSSCHLQHVELQRDFDAVEVGFVSCLEVNDVSLGFGRADVDVEGVHDGLPEVLRQSRTSQRRQVYSMEIFLVPKVDLQ